MPIDAAGGGPAEDATFTTFYAEALAPLVRLAYLLTGGSGDAEDIVQDAFANAHRRWGEIQHPPAYLRRAVVNGAASHRRRAALADRTRPSYVAAAAELGAHELRDAIAKLPYRQRAAVVLRYYEGLPEAAIAEALGCRVPAVKSLLHRALRDLREVIER